MLLLKKMFGQPPACSSASISVPGAPASSLLTDSQVLVLKPGVEIFAPVWVAAALLCTFHPPEPRSETLLAPVPAEANLAAAGSGAGRAAALLAASLPCGPAAGAVATAPAAEP